MSIQIILLIVCILVIIVICLSSLIGGIYYFYNNSETSEEFTTKTLSPIAINNNSEEIIQTEEILNTHSEIVNLKNNIALTTQKSPNLLGKLVFNSTNTFNITNRNKQFATGTSSSLSMVLNIIDTINSFQLINYKLTPSNIISKNIYNYVITIPKSALSVENIITMTSNNLDFIYFILLSVSNETVIKQTLISTGKQTLFNANNFNKSNMVTFLKNK